MLPSPLLSFNVPMMDMTPKPMNLQNALVWVYRGIMLLRNIEPRQGKEKE